MRPQITGTLGSRSETCCKVKGSYICLARSIRGRRRVPQGTTWRASQRAAAAVSHGNMQRRYWALLTADRQQCEWKSGRCRPVFGNACKLVLPAPPGADYQHAKASFAEVKGHVAALDNVKPHQKKKKKIARCFCRPPIRDMECFYPRTQSHETPDNNAEKSTGKRKKNGGGIRAIVH